MTNQRYKHPRIYHLPFSGHLGNDDKFHSHPEIFNDIETVVTLKLDGENSGCYSDGYTHARSMDSNDHPARHWLKQFADTWTYQLPKGWRVYGENMYAKHSVYYEDLKSYFYVHSIWNEDNICLSWNETMEWTSMLGLELVPYIMRLEPGLATSTLVTLEDYSKKWVDPDWKSKNEGFVIRSANSIEYNEYSDLTAKFVRKNHVTSNAHWMHSEIIKNKLKTQIGN